MEGKKIIEKEFMQRKVAIEVLTKYDDAGNPIYKTKMLPANITKNATYEEIVDYINHIENLITKDVNQFKEIVEYKLNEV